MANKQKKSAEQLAEEYARFMSNKDNIGNCKCCPETCCNCKDCWVKFAQQH